MTQTPSNILKMGLVCVASVTLAACFGSDNDTAEPPVVVTPPPPAPPPPPPPPPTGDGTPASYNAGFATAFAQDPFTDPLPVMDGDIIPVTLLADPPDIPNP